MREIVLMIVLMLIIGTITSNGEELNPPENQRAIIAMMADRLDVPVVITDLDIYNGETWRMENGSIVIYLDEQIFKYGYQKEEERLHKIAEWHYGKPIVAPDMIAENIGYDKYPVLVMTHEIGHLKMYRYNERRGSCLDMDCFDETDQWREIVENATSNGWELPTWYSKKDNSELFAECYTLLEYGYTDWLTPEIIDYIVEINMNWK